MRNTAIQEIFNIAKKDKNLMLLTGDLGFGVFEDFEKKFPKQFLNVGVAEQNMAMIAAGLSLQGKKVFIYSIGNFPTLRALEQIRNDICYHNLNVTIISVGVGFSYGQLGMSHHMTEDTAIMRALPNMTIVSPSTLDDVSNAIHALYALKSPSYIRLDKSYAELNLKKNTFKLGHFQECTYGNDVTIISTGAIIEEVIKASNVLLKENISCKILKCHTIKPISVKNLKRHLKKTKKLITVEEGNVMGGLGGTIAEICLENNIKISSFLRIGIKDEYSEIVGDQNYLREYYKINSLSIVRTIKKFLKK